MREEYETNKAGGRYPYQIMGTRGVLTYAPGVWRLRAEAADGSVEIVRFYSRVTLADAEAVRMAWDEVRGLPGHWQAVTVLSRPEVRS